MYVFRPKWHNSTVYQNIYINLPLFWKYVGIFTFWVLEFGELVFHELKFYLKILKFFYGTRVL